MVFAVNDRNGVTIVIRFDPPKKWAKNQRYEELCDSKKELRTRLATRSDWKLPEPTFFSAGPTPILRIREPR